MRDFIQDKAVCLAATPGPWHLVRYGNRPEGNEYVGEIKAEDGTKVFRGPFSFKALEGPENAQFIATSREALPYYMSRAAIRGSIMKRAANRIETTICGVCKMSHTSTRCGTCRVAEDLRYIREELGK